MSTGSTQPFVPSGTATLAATVASASVSLSQGDTVLVFNSSAAIAFVAFGNGAATALVASSTPVPAGAQMMLYVGPIANTGAAILSAGTGSVYFTSGTGTAR